MSIITLPIDSGLQQAAKRLERQEIKAPRLPVAGQKNAAYLTALELVARIDADLTRGIRHYRTQTGHLLTTLDEVIHALIDRTLAEPEEV